MMALLLCSGDIVRWPVHIARKYIPTLLADDQDVAIVLQADAATVRRLGELLSEKEDGIGGHANKTSLEARLRTMELDGLLDLICCAHFLDLADLTHQIATAVFEGFVQNRSPQEVADTFQDLSEKANQDILAVLVKPWGFVLDELLHVSSERVKDTYRLIPRAGLRSHLAHLQEMKSFEALKTLRLLEGKDKEYTEWFFRCRLLDWNLLTVKTRATIMHQFQTGCNRSLQIVDSFDKAVLHVLDIWSQRCAVIERECSPAALTEYMGWLLERLCSTTSYTLIREHFASRRFVSKTFEARMGEYLSKVVRTHLGDSVSVPTAPSEGEQLLDLQAKRSKFILLLINAIKGSE
jgi:hypothetical protein